MTTSYSHMVALGSSFAAGPGIPPVIDRKAMRSGRNYAHLVAAALAVPLVDATVSGATTATILDQSQRTFPPQIDAVHPAADLVTITAGGNDLGYIGGVFATAVLHRIVGNRVTRPLESAWRARRPLAAPAADRVRTATDGMTRIIDAIRVRAPAATVVLVDYLPIFTADPHAATPVPFLPADVDHFRGVAAILTDVFRTSAARTGATVLLAPEYDQTHGLGTAAPWVRGLTVGRTLPASFHPTALGMRAVADTIIGKLTS